VSDDPGFRPETHATVEPTDAELIAHYRKRAEAAEARAVRAEAEREELRVALQDCQAVALNGAAPGADPLDVIDEIADNALAALADAGQEGKP